MKKIMIFIVLAFFGNTLFAQNYNSLDSVNKEIQETYKFINKYSEHLYVYYVSPDYKSDEHAEFSELDISRMIFNIDNDENEGSYYSKLSGWIECDLNQLNDVSEYHKGLRLNFVSQAVVITGTRKSNATYTGIEYVTDLSEKVSFLEISIDDIEMRARMQKAFAHMADMYTERRALLQKASGDKF